MKICYVRKRFGAAALAILDHADAIIAEYCAKGYVLTLRQIYYQFISRDLFPDDRWWTQIDRKWVHAEPWADGATKNAPPNYKWLGALINDGRLAGLIDWDAIEDRTRNLEALSTWRDPAQIINAVARQYREDLWRNQPYYIEVWIEKEALAGVFRRSCNTLRVPFFCCRGYTSTSEMWSTAQRFIAQTKAGKEVCILHFGDHDPSGMDMSRDIEERLGMFLADVQFERLALNFDQVQQYNPPPNPAKEGDSRAEQYIKKYGDMSWELDALDPAVLDGLVRDRLSELIVWDQWDADSAAETQERDLLKQLATAWPDVKTKLEE